MEDVLSTEMELEAVIGTGRPVLVDYFAPWCGPCMAMMPLMDELKSEWSGRVHILKVDVDKNTDLAVEQKVMGVPTFVGYRHGREIWRQPGVLTPSELRRVLEMLAQ